MDAYGTIFRVAAGSKLKTLHAFSLTDGEAPRAALLQAANGELYGMASTGGNSSSCVKQTTGEDCGTIFKITPNGKLSVLHGCLNVFGKVPARLRRPLGNPCKISAAKPSRDRQGAVAAINPEIV